MHIGLVMVFLFDQCILFTDQSEYLVPTLSTEPKSIEIKSKKGSTRKLTFPPFFGSKAMFVCGLNGGFYNGTDGIRIVTTNGLGVLQGCLTEPIMSLVTSLHSLLAWF